MARGKLSDAETMVSEWYGDDPRRSLPQRSFYADWDDKERRVVADRKEDVTLLISDVRAWGNRHGWVWTISSECSRNIDQGHSNTEYTQYVKHLSAGVSHFHKNVGAMADGYLKGVADVNSRLRGILKPGAAGFD